MKKRLPLPTDDTATDPEDEKLRRVLLRLVDGGPERQAVEAGEIDAVIDYADKNVILFPTAERALRADSKLTSAPDPLSNSILAALPNPEYQRLHHTLEPVMLTAKEVLHESGAPIRYVYFPVDSVISLLATVENRRFLEVGLVGFEGMVGASLALGVNVSSVRSLVHVAGRAMRVPEASFREAYRQSPSLRRELNRYSYAELVLAGQTAACSAFHMIEQRLARRLLMTGDRTQSDRFSLTQELIAHALGVRRESITAAASRLQRRGLITYHRGNVRILNRRGLESVSCGCYTRIESLNHRIQPVQEASVAAR